jgi:hypothetical protein
MLCLSLDLPGFPIQRLEAFLGCAPATSLLEPPWLLQRELSFSVCNRPAHQVSVFVVLFLGPVGLDL